MKRSNVKKTTKDFIKSERKPKKVCFESQVLLNVLRTAKCNMYQKDKLLLGIVRQATKTNMQDCWSFTCCFSWTIGSLSKCGQLVCSIGITLVDVLQNWLSWFWFLFLKEDLFVILIDCMIFLSPFLYFTRMSVSTVSFLAQLNSGILCL